MIYGIGIDIVSVPRIERMLNRWGHLFTKRVFTPTEIAFCESRSNPGQHFALRWAVKEAMLKALGLGLRGGIKWTDIEVVNDPSGRPLLEVHNQAKGFFADRLCAMVSACFVPKLLNLPLYHSRDRFK